MTETQLALLEEAADIWESLLTDDVEFVINVASSPAHVFEEDTTVAAAWAAITARPHRGERVWLMWLSP